MTRSTRRLRRKSDMHESWTAGPDSLSLVRRGRVAASLLRGNMQA